MKFLGWNWLTFQKLIIIFVNFSEKYRTPHNEACLKKAQTNCSSENYNIKETKIPCIPQVNKVNILQEQKNKNLLLEQQNFVDVEREAVEKMRRFYTSSSAMLLYLAMPQFPQYSYLLYKPHIVMLNIEIPCKMDHPFSSSDLGTPQAPTSRLANYKLRPSPQGLCSAPSCGFGTTLWSSHCNWGILFKAEKTMDLRVVGSKC